jgi:hypothetical protein
MHPEIANAVGPGKLVRALTISQPWADKIASGDKWVENRTWETPYRGVLAIHAGKGSRYLTASELRGYTRGAVVALARLVACVRLQDGSERVRGSARLTASPHDAQELSAAGLSLGHVLAHEYTEGPVCWVLRDVWLLAKPVPAAGAQGVWMWDSSAMRPDVAGGVESPPGERERDERQRRLRM